MIFGTLNPQQISHENLKDLSTSRVRCSHFTLGNPKSHFSSIHNTSDYLCHLTRKVKVKFSHTRYRALGPELIPVYRQSARR